MIDQRSRIVFAALVPVFAKNRYKGLRKSPFGKHASQEIGKLEGHKKYVCSQSGAEGAGDHKVTDKSENPGEECHTTDRGQCA